MEKLSCHYKNGEEQMVVDFGKRMEMVVVDIFFQKRKKHRLTLKNGGWSTQDDHILCFHKLKKISVPKVVSGASVAD